MKDLFEANWTMGKSFGIPLSVKLSFLVPLAMMALLSGLWGVYVFLLAMVSVVLHEYGHVYAAHVFGKSCGGITLHMFGGVALVEMPEDNMEEAVVAVAGPLVSLILALIFGGVFYYYPNIHWAVIAYLNLVIFVFNLLPVFPLDGGRATRALLAQWFGQERGNRWAFNFTKLLLATGMLYCIVSGSFYTAVLVLAVWLFGRQEMRNYPTGKNRPFWIGGIAG